MFTCTAAEAELNGCILDCQNMRDMLIETMGVPEENITLLVDDGEEATEETMPTKDTIEVRYS